ncbi:MAG: sulfite exporter TauE/SafE family protein, partial [Gammaproteobacteria bacterium]
MEWLAAGLPQLLCGFVIGFLIAYSGVGGGAAVIPAMIVFFNLPASAAVGTASIYAAATKTAAGFAHWRIGNVGWRLCAQFTAAAAPGVLLSAGFVAYFSRHAEFSETLQTALRYCIVAVIAFSLVVAQFKPSGNKRSLPLLRAAAFAVGIVMGATGIGGGVLIVPALLLLSGESPKRVIGASIIIALALSTLAAAIYSGAQQADYALAAWMSCGAFLAAKPAAW